MFAGPVNNQKPGFLIQLILDRIAGEHLDVSLDNAIICALGYGFKAMPGVTPVGRKQFILVHALGLPPKLIVGGKFTGQRGCWITPFVCWVQGLAGRPRSQVEVCWEPFFYGQVF